MPSTDVQVWCTSVFRDEGISVRSAEKSAVEAIIHHVCGEGADVDHHPGGAPFLAGSTYSKYISISHSRRIAVVAFADFPVGIDAEEWRPQLSKVQDRFLSEGEKAYINTPDLLLHAWTIKEAAYKRGICKNPDLRAYVIDPDMHSVHIDNSVWRVSSIMSGDTRISLVF